MRLFRSQQMWKASCLGGPIGSSKKYVVSAIALSEASTTITSYIASVVKTQQSLYSLVRFKTRIFLLPTVLNTDLRYTAPVL
jgi:hypothetical protein